MGDRERPGVLPHDDEPAVGVDRGDDRGTEPRVLLHVDIEIVR